MRIPLTSVLDPFFFPKGPPSSEPAISDKTQTVARTKFFDICKGLSKSAIARSLVVTGVATAILFLIVSNPVGWVIGAVVAGSFATSFLSQLVIPKGKQKVEFEISALQRLCKTKNYGPIATQQSKGGLFLGALPNRLKEEGEHLANEKNVGAVLSINEPFETKPHGLSLPHTEKDWRDLGVEQHLMLAKDHQLLDNDQLDEAADFIHNQLAAGKNVYVHCRAGVGRSSMAIAAYLIKYEGKTFDQACSIILDGRRKATIRKKGEALISFQALCEQRNRV